jgi:hypothetical protein
MSSSLGLQMKIPPHFQIALFAALVFLVFGSPASYRVTDAYLAAPLKLDFADAAGTPTRLGLFVHSLVILAVMLVYLHTFDM